MLTGQVYLLGSPNGTGMTVAKPRGPDGFQILTVDKDGSAWRAGLRPGDCITKQPVGVVFSGQFEVAKDAFVDSLCALKTKRLVLFRVRCKMPESPLTKKRRVHITNKFVSDLLLM